MIEKKLRYSLGRPSRSNFVQLDFFEYSKEIDYNDNSLAREKCSGGCNPCGSSVILFPSLE